MKNLVYTLIFGLAWICTGCSDFLESQTPQGSVDEEQLQDPAYIDNLVISAYAVWISARGLSRAGRNQAAANCRTADPAG